MESEKKRRLFSNLSPTSAKKHLLSPCSEEKKVDVSVLKYKNQKLAEQLEVLRVECLALNNKFLKLKEKQKSHSDTLPLVRKSWEQLVSDLDSLSSSTSEFIGSGGGRNSCLLEDEASGHRDDDFIKRLVEIGATESSDSIFPSQNEVTQGAKPIAAHILPNVAFLFNSMWQVNEFFAASMGKSSSEDESSWQLETLHDLQSETGKFLGEIGDMHLKFRLLEDEFHNHQDLDMRNKAEHRRLTDEFASTVAELEESNCKLATLRTQKDIKQRAHFVLPSFGTQDMNEEVREEQNDLQQLEVSLKELTDLNSSRLAEIRKLYEERIGVLGRLAECKNTLMDTRSLSSSEAFLLLNERLQKSREELDQLRTLLEKLQVDKDNFTWDEQEINLKTDMADAAQRVLAFSGSRLAELKQILQKLADDRTLLETKLEEASREPRRKEIIAEFKALLASMPKIMADMQSELSKHKDDTSQLHSLRADAQSLSNMLHTKEKELQSLSDKTSHNDSEIKKLQLRVQDLRQTNQELKLFIEMYRRESTDSRDILESRDKEYKAWALVHTLKSSLDEHNLELRVKTANESEATTQKRLASAEGEIDELRQKLEDSEREMSKLSEILKSKHEEGEAYLSEIESIGQAYEVMQAQNQHLLHQIIERDDDNIKLAMEGVKARQMNDLLRLEIQTMNKSSQYANLLMDLYNFKIEILDEHIKIWSDQAGKLAEDVSWNSTTLKSVQRRLSDVQDEALQLRQSLDAMQPKFQRSRLDVSDLLIEIEKERFQRKRTEEELEIMAKKAASLRAQSKGTTVLEKLRQEVTEYRGILKCSICLERQKEVVIAKCYHLFCYQCVQKTLEHRQRRCPTCSLCFGPNDVKPIYI